MSPTAISTRFCSYRTEQSSLRTHPSARHDRAGRTGIITRTMHNKCRLSSCLQILKSSPANHIPGTQDPSACVLTGSSFGRRMAFRPMPPLPPVPGPGSFWPFGWKGWTKWGGFLPEALACGAGCHHSWTGTWPISPIRHHDLDGVSFLRKCALCGVLWLWVVAYEGSGGT